MRFRFRDPPPPPEICKRRGMTLSPVTTNYFNETTNGGIPEGTRIHIPPSPGNGQGKSGLMPNKSFGDISRWSSTTEDDSSDLIYSLLSFSRDQEKARMDQNGDYQEISIWSSTTEENSSQYPETESELDNRESYEEKLGRYRRFFNNRPLGRCLDMNEDQLLEDSLFERLLRELQQPGLSSEELTQNSRGEAQVRIFWENVRNQLKIDETLLEIEWPERYLEPIDGLGQ